MDPLGPGNLLGVPVSPFPNLSCYTFSKFSTVLASGPGQGPLSPLWPTGLCWELHVLIVRTMYKERRIEETGPNLAPARFTSHPIWTQANVDPDPLGSQARIQANVISMPLRGPGPFGT